MKKLFVSALLVGVLAGGASGAILSLAVQGLPPDDQHDQIFVMDSSGEIVIETWVLLRASETLSTVFYGNTLEPQLTQTATGTPVQGWADGSVDGGLGEIGLNMMVFEYGQTMFVIDAGLMFPEDYMLGVDFVIPDMDYLRQNRSKIAAVVLTHGHEDHIGALPYLIKDINVPIFGTSFTLGLVRQKLEELELISSAALHEINPEEKLRLGSLKLEFIRVGHSVVDGVGIAINTPLGRIVHTGDFKIGFGAIGGMTTDVNKFAWCGERGVLALLSDSTNVEMEGTTISDKAIGETLERIISDSHGRVIVALFASNVGRIQLIVDIAKARNKKIVFNGRSIEGSVQIAKSLGYLEIPENLEVDVEQVPDYAENEIIIITGTEHSTK